MRRAAAGQINVFARAPQNTATNAPGAPVVQRPIAPTFGALYEYSTVLAPQLFLRLGAAQPLAALQGNSAPQRIGSPIADPAPLPIVPISPRRAQRVIPLQPAPKEG